MMASDHRGMGLEGKNVVVLGVADESSLAWAITKRFAEHGARVFIGYQQKFFSRVRLLLLDNPAIQGDRCDVLKDEEITNFFGRFRDIPIDVLVHGIAFAPGEMFTEPPSETSADGFCQSLTISAHSLCKVVRFAKPSMRNWSSVITLTYQASERAEASYGLMGVAKAALEASTRYLAYDLGPKRIRVNCISAGPVNTLAARGIAGFTEMLKHYEGHSPLKRNVLPEELGATGLFLAGDGAAAITGQVIYVDCGYQIMGM